VTVNCDIPSNYTKYIADQLFNYLLKLITQHKALPHRLLKTQNRNVLQNTSQKARQIKYANYLPIHLSAMLRCPILKMILSRCNVNNTNCRPAVQTGRWVQCTVQSFVETFTVAYFLNNHSVCCNPNPITALTKTNKIMQFSHTDRTNSVHLASCCCSVSACMQLFILHDRTFRTVFVLCNVLPVWGSENERFAQNVTWDIKYCAVPST